MISLKQTKRTILFHAARSSIRALEVIPRSAAVFIGACLGLISWSLLPKDRHRIDRHLTLAYGNTLSNAEKHVIGRNFFVNYGKSLVDIARMKRHFHSDLLPRVEIEGAEHFEAAYQRGKGVIGVTGHIGNFELLAAVMASLGYRVGVIGRELYDPRLNSLLVSIREAVGVTNFSTTDSPKRMVKWLKSGGTIGVVIDTDSSRVRSIPVPAFGRLSNTPVGQTVMGHKLGCAFVPLFCLRKPDNTYKVLICPEVTVDPRVDSDTAAYQLTCCCTMALERVIDRHRDQWIWLHNRWHTRV
ncbi:MAG: lysophospholipid acyltransferase family protein [Candidatus Zixiibacteriota bacterium]